MNLSDLTKAFPYFQPIIRRDDQRVFAYEVLGRIDSDGGVRSLGPFFEDPAVPDSDKLAVDLLIRDKALALFAAADTDAKLFINIKPSWVMRSRMAGEDFNPIAMLHKHGVDPRRVVIEITEEEMLGDADHFSRIVAQYRKAGCLVAIDDFGKGASSIERIAQIMPDILKIDRAIVERVDLQRSFFDISNAMSSFGSFSGFDILFEGIETAYELEACIEARGRYYQGFIFSQARPEMDGKYKNSALLEDLLSLRRLHTLSTRTRRRKMARELHTLVSKSLETLSRKPEEYSEPEALSPFALDLPAQCLQYFICDEGGNELSFCYDILPGNRTTVTDRRTNCWFYNDFFLTCVDGIQEDRPWHLSHTFKDVDTKGDVAAYMQLLPNGCYICILILSMNDL